MSAGLYNYRVLLQVPSSGVQAYIDITIMSSGDPKLTNMYGMTASALARRQVRKGLK